VNIYIRFLLSFDKFFGIGSLWLLSLWCLGQECVLIGKGRRLVMSLREKNIVAR